MIPRPYPIVLPFLKVILTPNLSFSKVDLLFENPKVMDLSSQLLKLFEHQGCLLLYFSICFSLNLRLLHCLIFDRFSISFSIYILCLNQKILIMIYYSDMCSDNITGTKAMETLYKFLQLAASTRT